jgi:hypothetical protein
MEDSVATLGDDSRTTLASIPEADSRRSSVKSYRRDPDDYDVPLDDELGVMADDIRRSSTRGKGANESGGGGGGGGGGDDNDDDGGNEWIEATTDDGTVYFYNKLTRKSVWERPAQLVSSPSASPMEVLLTSETQFTAADIKELLVKLRDGNPPTKIRCCTSLARLAITDDRCKVAICSVGGAQVIAWLARHGPEDVRESAVQLLGALSVLVADPIASTAPGELSPRPSAAVEDVLGRIGAIEAIVHVVNTGSAHGKEKAALALSHFALSPAYDLSIARSNAIAALANLLRSNRTSIQLAALEAVSNMCDRPAIQEVIAHAEIVPSLVKLMRTGTATAQQRAVRALIVLSACSAFELPRIITASIKPLCVMVKTGSPWVQAKAAEIIWNLSSRPELDSDIMNARAEVYLVNLCSDYAGLVAAALAAGTPRPTSPLPSESHILRLRSAAIARAAGALANMSCEPANRAAILKTGGLAAMVKMLGCGVPRGTEEALACLAHLLQGNAVAISEVAQGPGISSLVKTVESGTPCARERALAVLAQAAYEQAEAQRAIGKTGGVAAALAVIRTFSANVASNGMMPETASLGSGAGSVRSVSSVLSTTLPTPPPLALEYAVTLLLNLIGDPYSMATMGNEGAIPELLLQLRRYAGPIQERALSAIGALCGRNEENRQALRSHGGVDLLRNIVRNCSLSLKELAAAILEGIGEKLTADEKNIIQIKRRETTRSSSSSVSSNSSGSLAARATRRITKFFSKSSLRTDSESESGVFEMTPIPGSKSDAQSIQDLP